MFGSAQRTARLSPRRMAYVLAFFAASGLLSCSEIRAQTNSSGLVQFSNGEIVEGAISMTAGNPLRIHTGKELRSLPLDVVREIRFEPEKEAMEQKWRFVEAGRTQKEKWGQPYPVREIKATVLLAHGETVQGHIYTTVLYVEGEQHVTKVVLRAKDRGEEGQKLSDLVYPVRVFFSDRAFSPAGAVRIKVRESGATELVALTPGALARLPASRIPDTNEFQLSGLANACAFVAVKTDQGIRVGWPVGSDTGLVARIENALENVEDFFDSKKLLGVYRSGEDLYSLVMLHRTGQTTLGSAKSQPWRLEIWRWRDSGDGIMIAGRGFFFKGIVRQTEEPPRIIVLPEMRMTELKDGAELP